VVLLHTGCGRLKKQKKDIMKSLIIDGDYLMNRAWYSSLSTYRDSDPFKAINLYMAAVKDVQPDNVFWVFDGQPTLRQQLLPTYKANRETVEGKSEYVDLMRNIITDAGFQVIRDPDLEGDDLIASLTAVLPGDVVILTGDGDLFHLLVKPNVLVYYMTPQSKTVMMGIPEFVDKYSIYPDQWLDYKALVGDISDNIKGVHNIGPKTAKLLLSLYTSLDGIYAALKDGKVELSKVRLRNLTQGYKDAYLARKVVAPIITDLAGRWRVGIGFPTHKVFAEVARAYVND